MINEQINNLFNFTLINNAYVGVTTICEIILTVDLQILSKHFVNDIELCKMMNMCIYS